MTPEQQTPGIAPDSSVDTDPMDTIDLTIEKLGPRLALDNTEGGSSATTGSCTLSGTMCGGRG
ncbi:hypothetical protein [Streptomyces armeniacus]|uniref:hypothetical protein n=1 Tax=Streptomyces armeniacus TaxID=83291 RepID=UPI001AD84C04|nr:hypothetical protein [Streptomyces armeniacus]